MIHLRYGRCFVSVASALFVVGAFGTGCTKLHYDVVAPAEARGEVARNAGAHATRDGIEYEVFQAGDQAVIHYVNRTGGPIQLSAQSTMLDSTGRAFAVETEELAPDQSGRLLVPPTFATDRTEPRAVATEVRVGGYDEGGIVTRERLDGATTAEPMRGFRWPDGGRARFRLVFEAASGNSPTTEPATSQPAAIMHEWILTRGR